MDLAVKYEVTHFIDDTRDRQARQETKKMNNLTVKNGKPFKEKSSREKGRFQPKTLPTEDRLQAYRCSIRQIQMFPLGEGPGEAGKRSTTSVKGGPGGVESVTRTVKIENVSLNVLCENPLICKSRPPFSVTGEISLDGKTIVTRSIPLDCGATTIYVSKRWINEHQLETKKFEDKNIRVKLGDNQIVETKLEVVPIEIEIPGLGEIHKCVAVVNATPDEFDCTFGIPFIEDMQPQIDWRASEICGSIEEGGPVIASGLRRSVEAKGLSAKRPDSRRGAALETDVTSAVRLARDAVQKVSPTVVQEQQQDASTGKDSAVNGDSESIWGKDSIVEKIFTKGVVDEIGVQTKYFTRKNLKKFLRIKIKSIEEPDFMLMLSKETTKRVARTPQRQDQPASVITAQAQRYLETDWKRFQDNPAFNLLVEYKDNVFRPELPEVLPEKREIERRIDVKDLNLAMCRQQWRQSPEQQREIVRWVIDIVKKKLIRPSISPHAAPTFCVRKPVGWRIVHDFRYLNSNTVRQSIPMTRKEDILDAMAGSYWLSTMDLMSAYYQVRMREEDNKFTAFQAPNGLWEYLVLPMGVCNAPATMHRLTSKIFRDLKNSKSFYDDICIFTKSPRIEDHLDALRESLDILRENKLYVKLSKCGFCAEEISCLRDFVGRNGVRMDPDKAQIIKDWRVPRTQEELHSFLGLSGYVPRFCPAYATLTASMFALLKKKNKRNVKVHFNDELLKNVKELKQRLCNPPVLHLPDFSQPMHLRTDASKFAVGGVLFQVVNGVDRPIAYTSRKIKPAELNYPTQ
ncbi:Polyprotein [Phytophthora palmivora]|uniref:Polyprotein n=1 Tax=Phytophthora palmivora TaxID=4796 RepID=A0A2P4YRE7_9STRA|nr:Polyprotein [Phytophthora palmivora]